MIEVIQKPLIAPGNGAQAKLFMCNACCCGDSRFNGPREPIGRLRQALESSLARAGVGPAVTVQSTRCMGPCAIGNNVILATAGHNLFFKKMNRSADMEALGRFAVAGLKDPKAELPAELESKLEDQKDF